MLFKTKLHSSLEEKSKKKMYKQLLILQIFNRILWKIKNNLFKFNFETHQFLNDSLTSRQNILFFQSVLT